METIEEYRNSRTISDAIKEIQQKDEIIRLQEEIIEKQKQLIKYLEERNINYLRKE